MAGFILPAGGGNPIVFGIEVVVSIISQIFGGLFGGSDVGALSQAVQNLAAQVSKALDVLKRFAWTIVVALGKLLVAFHDAWVSFITKLWEILKNVLAGLKWLYTTLLPQLAKALRDLRKWLDDIYKKYIRPVLNYLQLVRRYLAILRALHVPFADKLDKILTRIEARIIGPYLYVLRAINGMGSWVNLVVTRNGVIQRSTFVNTMYAYQRDWVNMFWAGQEPPAIPTGLQPAVLAASLPDMPQLIDELSEYAYTGSGPLAPDLDLVYSTLQAMAPSP